MSALTVASQKKFSRVRQKDIRGTIAPGSATQTIEGKTGSLTNRVRGEAVLVGTSRTEGGSQRIKSGWLTSRLVDMQEKKAQMVHTLLKSGRNLKRYTVMCVLYVKKISHLPKTMLSHFLKEVQIILLTFSHYVGTAIVRSGVRFNIYENPEMLETNNDI